MCARRTGCRNAHQRPQCPSDPANVVRGDIGDRIDEREWPRTPACGPEIKRCLLGKIVPAQRRAEIHGYALTDRFDIGHGKTRIVKRIHGGRHCKLRGPAHAPGFFGIDELIRIKIHDLCRNLDF